MGVAWEKMKSERERRSLSVAEVVEMAGICESAYRRLEAGEIKKVHAATARGLAKAFDVEPACINGSEAWKSNLVT